MFVCFIFNLEGGTPFHIYTSQRPPPTSLEWGHVLDVLMVTLQLLYLLSLGIQKEYWFYVSGPWNLCLFSILLLIISYSPYTFCFLDLAS